MERSKMNFIAVFIATASIACNLAACNNQRTMEVTEEVEGTEEIEVTEERVDFGDIVSKIGDCLSEQVPEIDEEWYEYVWKKTNGKAHLYCRFDSRVDDVYRDGKGSEYLGKYYAVYVGEMWDDHSANWDWFYVSEDFKEVLWCEIVECKYYSLEDWRASLRYKERQQRITEYLEEVEKMEEEGTGKIEGTEKIVETVKLKIQGCIK